MTIIVDTLPPQIRINTGASKTDERNRIVDISDNSLRSLHRGPNRKGSALYRRSKRSMPASLPRCAFPRVQRHEIVTLICRIKAALPELPTKVLQFQTSLFMRPRNALDLSWRSWSKGYDAGMSYGPETPVPREQRSAYAEFVDARLLAVAICGRDLTLLQDIRRKLEVLRVIVELNRAGDAPDEIGGETDAAQPLVAVEADRERGVIAVRFERAIEDALATINNAGERLFMRKILLAIRRLTDHDVARALRNQSSIFDSKYLNSTVATIPGYRPIPLSHSDFADFHCVKVYAGTRSASIARRLRSLTNCGPQAKKSANPIPRNSCPRQTFSCPRAAQRQA
jgi:hypothetical protein